MTGGPPLLAEQAAFDALIASLAGEPLLALDTEAASFHRYRDRVYLLQLSTRTRTVIVDPLAVPDLGALRRLVADPAVEVLFHDADYDLRLLRQEHQVEVATLFDTRVAAQFLNEPGIGLAALLEKYFGITLDKQYQRADWSARPLTPGMLAYAAADTAHLPALRDLLREQLVAKGRLAWAEEEFARQRLAQWAPEAEQEPGWLKLKGAKALRGRELAIVRELWQWRDELAARLDKAPFRILNNEPIFAIAKLAPTELEALRAVRGIGPDGLERRGREIVAAVKRALQRPDAETLRPPRGPRPVFDPTFDERLERLKAARTRVATRLDLPPGVTCPNGTLEAIARRAPETLEQLAEVKELRRWQLGEMGEELLGALRADGRADGRAGGP
ncbi:MAG: HRDC domain-containing protein [Gemmatimonadales bacterium]|nr:HRDC domain-containing protein [Gemmatimonadales bacterium]